MGPEGGGCRSESRKGSALHFRMFAVACVRPRCTHTTHTCVLLRLCVCVHARNDSRRDSATRNVQKGRDGVTTAKILAFGKEDEDDVSYYMVEYQSSSSRGDKHFISKVTIVGKRLYVLTALAKKDKFDEEEAALRAAVESFAVSAAE